MDGGSPKYDSLVLSNLSSPRFDISDFLKTPTDGSSDENFNLSVPNSATPTLDMFTSLPPFNSSWNLKVEGGQDPDFGSLLFDMTEGQSESGCLYPTLDGDLISFDDADIARDSFAPFSDSHCDLVNDSSSLISNAPYLGAESRLPSLNFPLQNQIIQPGLYMGSDLGGLMNVEERALTDIELGASALAVSNSPLYGHNYVEWGMPQEAAALNQHNLVQQSTLQCESCQLLRRIVHSNGVQDTKLEIHGCGGQSYHAVLQTRFCIDDGFPSPLEQQMVEFPVGNAEYVKQFLLQYSLLRGKEGFVLQHDSFQVPTTDLGSGIIISSDGAISSAVCISKQAG
eukprot:c14469_g1_i1 orf=45-1067(-)